jgi:hypothetical protein
VSALPFASRRAAPIACAVVLSLSLGCAGLRWPFGDRAGYDSAFTEEDLDTELSAYTARFAAEVGSAAGDIHDQTTDRTLRKRALIWQLQMPPILEEAVYDQSPRLAYVACVIIATMQQKYLTDGDGKDLFGDLQSIAVTAATGLRDDALSIGEQFLPAGRLQDVAARAEDLASKYPIRGRDFSMQRIPRARVRAEATESLGWLFAIPLSPFRALQGVDTGAAAIRDFNQTAQEFAQITARLPERVRGQLELFLYDVEDRETVQRSTAALDRAAESAERASLAAERLPEDLRKALLESQGSVDSLGSVVAQAQALVGPLSEAAGSLEQASADWLAVLGPKSDAPPAPGERPFDVRDWQATAQSIGAAAAELRGLAGELQALTGSSGLDAAIDRAFWRLAALIVLFFAALVAYRLIATRLAGPRA